MSTAVRMEAPALRYTSADLFFAHLAASPERLLLLDYDGTIAPFAANRLRALPYPTVPELLDAIMSTCRTRVALISGRAAREIPPLLGIRPHPEIWGTYGFERLGSDGAYSVLPMKPEEQLALEQAAFGLEAEGVQELMEPKPGALAVHWRGLRAAHAEEVRASAYRVLAPFAGRDLWLAEFDCGLELRVRARSKGDVVHTILAEHGRHLSAAYLGDDASDEDAFHALEGRGLSVLVRSAYRFTAAQLWIRPPAELVEFLTNWVRACGGEM